MKKIYIILLSFITKLMLNRKENACLDFSRAGELGEANAYEIIRKKCN